MRARPSAWGALSILLALPALGVGQEGDANGVGQPVADYDKPPKPLKMTRPQYPKAAFDAKIEGTVVVEILIDEKGQVHPQRILTSIPALDAAAIATVKEWVFSPAKKKGRAVASIAHAPIGFRAFDKPPDQAPKPPSSSPLPPSPVTAGTPQQSSIAQEAPPVVQPPPSAKRQMGGLSFDPEGADFTAWVNQWKDQVYRNWIVPPSGLLGFRGHTDLECVVERDGSLSSTRLLRSAGQLALDRAALEALRGGRFLPLPEAFHSPRLTVNVSFYYNEGPAQSAPSNP
jgi:TonB family protein